MANYSSHRTCSYCRQTGHNRRTCPELAKSSYGQRMQQRSRESASNRRCGFCNQKGHTQRTCPVKRAMIDEATARINDVRSVWLEKRKQLGMGEHAMIRVYPLYTQNRYSRSQWGDAPRLLMVGIDDGYLHHRYPEAAKDRSQAMHQRNTMVLNCYAPRGIAQALEIKQGRGHWYHLGDHTELRISLPSFEEASKEWDFAGTWTKDSWINGGAHGNVTEAQMRDKAFEVMQKVETGEVDSHQVFEANWKKFQQYVDNNDANMTMGYFGNTLCLIEVVSATKVAEDYSDRETWAEWYNSYARGKDNNFRDFKNLVTNKTYDEQRAEHYSSTWWSDELKARFDWSDNR